jgi:tagatose 6-phosphate kinase
VVIEPKAVGPKRILAAGLSPAWQQIMVFDRFDRGNVNRAKEIHWCASGKVLNVGIALAHLTRKTNTVSRTLSVIGSSAKAAIDPEFAALGVDCRWIETAAQTRICTTILDRHFGDTTELVENARPLTDNELARFRRAFAEEAATADVIVLTGSLPPNVPVSFYQELLLATNTRAVLDIRGPELLAALEWHPYCLKPNRAELAKTLGGALSTDQELHSAMRELNRRGAQWVVISQGADSVWAANGGNLFRFDPPAVERIFNPIASGDCLAAGIAWATAKNMNMFDAIRLGIAAAADNVGQLLPARLDHKRMEDLQKGVRFTKEP